MSDLEGMREHKPSWVLHIAPIDILALITSFVDGVSCGRLVLSGDVGFVRKLSELGGVRSFELRGKEGRKVPPSSFLSKLGKLMSLRIDIVGNVRQESLTSLSPSKLPVGLVRIEFKFKWAEWIWKSLSTHRILDDKIVFATKLEEEAYSELQVAQMFPSLEKLELEGWPALRDSFILVLPNLTELSLPSNPFLTPACLPYLPAHLLTLSLPSATGWDPSSFFSLPSSLTSLHYGLTSHLHSSTFSFLPKNLESLTLGFINLFNDDIKHLPRSLQSLTFSVDTSHTSSPGFHLLPERLSHLKLIFSKRKLITDAHIADLPKNLTSLHLNSKAITHAGFSSLPPKLISFTLSDVNNLSKKCFDVMPSSITFLSLPSCFSLGQADVPASKPNLTISSAVTP